MTKSELPDRNRLETTLAYSAAGVIVVSVLTMIVSLIWLATGSREMPALLGMIPVIGLPIGFILVIVLLVSSMVRRAKQNR